MLVLVDQFEELFRFKRSRAGAGHDEAVAFVKLLLEASRSTATCPSTSRSPCARTSSATAWNSPSCPRRSTTGLYLVPRMTRDELRAAITGPVAVGGGGDRARASCSRLLNDVGDDPDQLPILQHALMRTWDRWEERSRAGRAARPAPLRGDRHHGRGAVAARRRGLRRARRRRPARSPRSCSRR